MERTNLHQHGRDVQDSVPYRSGSRLALPSYAAFDDIMPCFSSLSLGKTSGTECSCALCRRSDPEIR